MKLSMSNIVWQKGADNFESFCKQLNDNGIFNVELALNCIFKEPANISLDNIFWLRNILEKYKLNVSAIHSLTFTRDDLVLFDTEDTLLSLIEYIKKYIILCKAIDCKNIVFGSPKSRVKFGKPKELCNDIFYYFLSSLDYCLNGVNFNIEPLCVEYCEYLNTYKEVYELLLDKNLKNCYIQLDIRSIIESNEDIDYIFSLKPKIKHVHVGNPGLKCLDGLFIQKHTQISNFLKSNNYDGYITLEMLYDENCNISREEFVNRSISEVREIYG